jgi:hypothetical protein
VLKIEPPSLLTVKCCVKGVTKTGAGKVGSKGRIGGGEGGGEVGEGREEGPASPCMQIAGSIDIRKKQELLPCASGAKEVT